MDSSLNKKDSNEIKDINNNLNDPNLNGNNDRDQDSISEKKIITELEKIDYNVQNEKQNNDLSKSFSDINKNNSYEDKKTISLKTLSDYNNIISRPLTKTQIVEISRLSQRVSKDEKENEFNNRIMVKELRLKYFPNNKKYKNIKNSYTITIENKNQNQNKDLITENNFKFKNFSNNTNIINNKIELNKKINKPNLILDDFNEIKTNLNNKQNIINSENIDNKLHFDYKKKFFLNILKEDNSYINKIRPITKEELLNYSNEKEKIIILMEKNTELINTIRNIFNKYNLLKNEYIELYKNSNNNLEINENDEYKKYLNNENKNMKIKIDNYEKIFPSIIYYINEINSEFNLKKINFNELKENINSYDIQIQKNNNDKKNPLNIFINELYENKKIILKYIKDGNDIINNNNKKFNKIRSHSNLGEDEAITKEGNLTSRKDDKKKKKKNV